jgi:hypothetical protein
MGFMNYLLIALQSLGLIFVFFWFTSSSRFFYLLKKYRGSNPLFLFFLPLGFVLFPALLAFCYNLSWELVGEEKLINAMLISTFPIFAFFVGKKVFQILE